MSGSRPLTTVDQTSFFTSATGMSTERTCADCQFPHDFPIVTIGVLLFGWWFQTVFIVHFIFFSSWLKPPTSFGFCYSRKPWLFTMKYWGFPVKVPNKTNPLRFWLTGPTASRILADLASEDSSRLLSSFRCVLKGDRSGNPSGGTEDQKTPPKSKVARKSPN